MNSNTFEGSSSQELPVNADLHALEEAHQEELENVAQVLAAMTRLSPDAVKPHLHALLHQLVHQEQPPFHATATSEEWIASFGQWAAQHQHDAPPLSDKAISRESMYEDERL